MDLRSCKIKFVHGNMSLLYRKSVIFSSRKRSEGNRSCSSKQNKST